MKRYLSALLILVTLACAEESTNGEGGSESSLTPPSPPNGERITDRAGPMSVSGSRWTSGAQVFDDFEIELLVEFTEDEIILSGICERTTTVSVRSPIKYTYSVQITQGNANETREGDKYCEVFIEPTQFRFEQAGGNLLAYAGDESIIFEGAPGNQGIYGQWSFTEDAEAITWWMGNNTLTARAECANGLSAQVQTPAVYKSFFSVQESAESGDDLCSLSLEASSNLEYRFEGDELILMQGDEETRLRRE